MRTPFYAESGGQVGDRGVLRTTPRRFRGARTRRSAAMASRHMGQHAARGACGVGEPVRAPWTMKRAPRTALNHSATHLLHAALRQVLGEHVAAEGLAGRPGAAALRLLPPGGLTRDQIAGGGALGEPLRFAATAWSKPASWPWMTPWRLAPWPCSARSTPSRCGCCAWAISPPSSAAAPMSGAPATSAVQDRVRGRRRRRRAAHRGDHRRAALEWMQDLETRLQRTAELLKGAPEDMEDKVQPGGAAAQAGEGGGADSRPSWPAPPAATWRLRRSRWAGSRCWRHAWTGPTPRGCVIPWTSSRTSWAPPLWCWRRPRGQGELVAGVTKDFTDRIKAGDLVEWVAAQVGGKGGGRPDMAQGGGTNPGRLPEALRVCGWVRQRL